MHPIEREVKSMNIIVLKIGGSILAKLPDTFYKMLVELKKYQVFVNQLSFMVVGQKLIKH